MIYKTSATIVFVAAMLRILLLLGTTIICASAQTADVDYESLSVYLTTKYIRDEGYVSETHHVTTVDGYILEMNRIPYPRFRNEPVPGIRPVVFLMHGLTSSSLAYVFLGHDYSMAYNLADAGFDVWIGNQRGNKNSRRHVTLNPDAPRDKLQFFDFSWEEIGMYDLPAMIDYILNETGRQQLHYIGHSQGGTVFLVMGSMRPEYNAKIASAHLLAGVGYMQYFPDTELVSTAALTDIIYSMAVGTGMVELFPPNSTETKGYSALDGCLGDVAYRDLCDQIGVRKYSLMRVNKNANINKKATDINLNNKNGIGNNGLIETKDNEADEYNILDDYLGSNDGRGGGSIKQVAHYGQNIRDKTFRRWNYGLLGNLVHYLSFNPPAYNLGLITCNVTMHYAINDALLDERDVLAMAADMPNVRVRQVARSTFLHEDFVAAVDAKVLVTDYVIENLLNVEKNLPVEVNTANGEEVIVADAGKN